MRRLSRGALGATFARSFLIQGSWNYHTMLGSGFAFAVLPGLRKLFAGDDAALRESLDRHLEHFNAHPYLASMALGATLRLEAEGADEAIIRRFKIAVRGPLGGLGDSLVWAAWLPGVSMLALILYWLGAPVWVPAVFFLVLYNIGHVGLRIWGFRTGLREGQLIGRRLAVAGLPRWATKLKAGSVLVLGALVGATLAGRGGIADSGLAWTVLSTGGFILGLLGGHYVWRPTAVFVVIAVAAIATWGVIR